MDKPQLNDTLREYDRESADYVFTTEDIALLEARRNARLNGESEVYDWKTAKAMIAGRA